MKFIDYKKKKEERNFIPLGTVSYMDHMLSFGMVKYQHFEDIIYLEMLCNNFQCPFWSLSLSLFTLLKNMQSTLVTCTSSDPLFACS